MYTRLQYFRISCLIYIKVELIINIASTVIYNISCSILQSDKSTNRSSWFIFNFSYLEKGVGLKSPVWAFKHEIQELPNLQINHQENKNMNLKLVAKQTSSVSLSWKWARVNVQQFSSEVPRATIAIQSWDCFMISVSDNAGKSQHIFRKTNCHNVLWQFVFMKRYSCWKSLVLKWLP